MKYKFYLNYDYSSLIYLISVKKNINSFFIKNSIDFNYMGQSYKRILLGGKGKQVPRLTICDVIGEKEQ